MNDPRCSEELPLRTKLGCGLIVVGLLSIGVAIAITVLWGAIQLFLWIWS